MYKYQKYVHKVINPNSPFFGQMGYNQQNINGYKSYMPRKKLIYFPETKKQEIFWNEELEFIENP